MSSICSVYSLPHTPSPKETPEEREPQMQRENDAKNISDKIDEMMGQERIERQKSRAEVNVLLLGQSESGKSTTLKQFQLLHTPFAFHTERIAWRAVIYLNLLRSVRRILDALSPERDVDDHEDESVEDSASVIIPSNDHPPSAISGTRVPNYDMYRQRLEPLVHWEERLTRLLTAPGEDEPTHLPLSWQESGTINGSFRLTPTMTGGNRPKSLKSAHFEEIEGWWEDPDDLVHALNACAPAMLDLWKDPCVRQRLEEKRLRLKESAGFYLNDIPRITAKKYIPTDADVLKARLKTIGVIEHSFHISSGTNRGVQWKIYDVGGARNQRHAWAPYFEVNAIIFLAPISAFDQVLTEDHRVNRLEDSLLLWKGVTSNKLLANVNIVLFLNKCDLLQDKLDAGVRLNHHMVSYGDRPNDYDSVSKYFRNKFGAIHQSVTPNKERELYIHLTAVTDTSRTVTIIADVRDIIIRGNLRSLRLV
ncbi:G-alpha-domain-containing protein [Gymnopus androsaceus JB14]|uniref:G-alpha-domain-containing protein n=1 Tax=Gymnopus androsaceus JB14 TaxID=1447944 RepID=A0A6A4HBY3_9AGAR|nr:G-alpha-domain-containing protein [Gymnopus androsaceus JB14]